MTSIPGNPTAGPAAEAFYWVECSRLGLECEPWAAEAKLSPYALDIAHRTGMRWKADPDFITYGTVNGRDIAFGAEVKGVLSAHDGLLRFTVPYGAPAELNRWSAAHRAWALYAFVAWDYQDIRICTPQQAQAQGVPGAGYKYLVIDGSRLPTLEQWVNDPPPFIGGALMQQNVRMLRAA